MKKKLVSLLILLTLTILPAFSSIDYGINVGDKLSLYSGAVVVRDDCPNEKNRTSAIATLPQGTEVTIKILNGDWVYVEWYSKVNNKYRYAWASTTALCISSGKGNINACMGRLGGQMHEISYINMAAEDIKNKDYHSAIKNATCILNAIFSLTSIKDPQKNTLSDFNERIASAYIIRSYAYSLLGEYRQAIEDITESMKYQVLKSAYELRAINYEYLGYYSKAKSDYLKAKQSALLEQNEKQVIRLNECIKRMNTLIQKAK